MDIFRVLARFSMTAAMTASLASLAWLIALTMAPAAIAAFPDKPLRLVVPLAPGGGTDLLARLLGPKLTDRLGQPVVIDNKPGANQMVGGEFVAKSAPDGYTLLMGGSSMTLLSLRRQGTPVDMRRDLAPITTFAETPYVILANRDAPFKTLPEFIRYAKANPGKVNFGTSGQGGSVHLLGEWFSKLAGISMVAIHYKGSGPQTVGLMSGEIQVSIDGIGATNPHIMDGRINLLGTSGTRRTTVFPNAPTVAETVPAFVAKGWYGVLAPAGTPRDVIMRLHGAIVAAATLPDIQERITGMSMEAATITPEEYARMIAADVERWGAVAREAGVVIE
jgi:tripartite-type tricarboxylate transporter receptor subunit TctC